MQNHSFKIFWLITIAFLLQACGNDDLIQNEDISSVSSDSLEYNPDWTFISHGNANQNYEVVFPQDAVNKIEIVLTAAQWNQIKTNMKSLFGYDFGSNTRGGGGFPEEETDYTDVLMKFNGKSWKNVGFRLKGNSSLAQAWGEGNYKLPFFL